MGLFDELSKALAPHAHKLNDTLTLQGALLHTRLARIEDALLDRPLTIDAWFRMHIGPAQFTGEEPRELAVVPMNEVWLFQAIVSDGVKVTSPAYVIECGGNLISSVIAQGVGTEKLGGDVVGLPGEKIVLTARTTGTVSACFHIVRRQLPAQKLPKAPSASTEGVVGSNTHDPARDLVTARVGTYQELPPEIADSTGHRG